MPQKRLIFSNVDLPDIDEIMKIEAESFLDPWSEMSFKSECEAEFSRFIKVSINEEIIGYVSYWLFVDHEANINNLCVKPKFRRKGIAKAILKHIAEDMKKGNIDIVTLEVRVSNLSAIGLYNKFGFVERGIRPHYYQDGESALIMEKLL